MIKIIKTRGTKNSYSVLLIKLSLLDKTLSTIYTEGLLKSRTLTFEKIFAKLKFSPALSEMIPSFACLVFKIKNK